MVGGRKPRPGEAKLPEERKNFWGGWEKKRTWVYVLLAPKEQRAESPRPVCPLNWFGKRS